MYAAAEYQLTSVRRSGGNGLRIIDRTGRQKIWDAVNNSFPVNNSVRRRRRRRRRRRWWWWRRRRRRYSGATYIAVWHLFRNGSLVECN